MSERVVVPEGMMEAVRMAVGTDPYDTFPRALEAALLWLSEHPIVPTDEKIGDSYRNCNGGFGLQADDPESAYANGFRHGANWSQRLFAPEPDVPEAVKDLQMVHLASVKDQADLDKHVTAIALEAYRRGLRDRIA